MIGQHTKRRVLAVEDLKDNFGQHWEPSWIGQGSYSIPNAKKFNTISEFIGLIYDLISYPKRHANAKEDLEPNFGQHWELSWIGQISFGIPNSKKFNSISDLVGLIHGLFCTLNVKHMLKRIQNPFFQHWESSWIEQRSFRIPKATKFINISELNGLISD